MESTESNIIRINFAEQWSAADFSELLSQLQFLADAALFSEATIDLRSSLYFPLRQYRRRRLFYDLFSGDQNLQEDAYLRRLEVQDVLRRYASGHGNELQVKRLQYSSPGLADLAGLGKVVEQVRIFIQYIIDLPDKKKHRK
jgi:hypothetical protein